MLDADYPILEYDPSPDAIIEPSRVLSAIDIAPHCVLCFFQDVISRLRDQGALCLVYTLRSEMGPNPVYEMDVDGRAGGPATGRGLPDGGDGSRDALRRRSLSWRHNGADPLQRRRPQHGSVGLPPLD